MLLTWSCQYKNLSIFRPRYFIEFVGQNLFPLSLIFISSKSTFLGDLKSNSSVFYLLGEILFGLNQLFKFFISHWLAYLDFLHTYLYEKDLYHQQSEALCSIELPCGNH